MYLKDRVLIAIAYPFLQLRLDNYVLSHISSYLQIVPEAEFMWIHVNLYLDFSRAYHQKWLTCCSKENSGYDRIIFAVRK